MSIETISIIAPTETSSRICIQEEEVYFETPDTYAQAYQIRHHNPLGQRTLQNLDAGDDAQPDATRDRLNGELEIANLDYELGDLNSMRQVSEYLQAHAERLQIKVTLAEPKTQPYTEPFLLITDLTCDPCTDEYHEDDVKEWILSYEETHYSVVVESWHEAEQAWYPEDWSHIFYGYEAALEEAQCHNLPIVDPTGEQLCYLCSEPTRKESEDGDYLWCYSRNCGAIMLPLPR